MPQAIRSALRIFNHRRPRMFLYGVGIGAAVGCTCSGVPADEVVGHYVMLTVSLIVAYWVVTRADAFMHSQLSGNLEMLYSPSCNCKGVFRAHHWRHFIH